MIQLTPRHTTLLCPHELGYIGAIKNIWKRTFQICYKILMYVTTVVTRSVFLIYIYTLRNFLAHASGSRLHKKRALRINSNPEKSREIWQLFRERDTESSINISTVLQIYNTTKSWRKWHKKEIQQSLLVKCKSTKSIVTTHVHNEDRQCTKAGNVL
jgi:hypothetical protein